MKTNSFKKSGEAKNNTLEEMNKDEMKTIQGGGQYYIIKNPDGTIEVHLYP
jgi:bacteriocin-type signal sequence